MVKIKSLSEVPSYRAEVERLAAMKQRLAELMAEVRVPTSPADDVAAILEGRPLPDTQGVEDHHREVAALKAAIEAQGIKVFEAGQAAASEIRAGLVKYRAGILDNLKAAAIAMRDALVAESEFEDALNLRDIHFCSYPFIDASFGYPDGADDITRQGVIRECKAWLARYEATGGFVAK